MMSSNSNKNTTGDGDPGSPVHRDMRDVNPDPEITDDPQFSRTSHEIPADEPANPQLASSHCSCSSSIHHVPNSGIHRHDQVNMVEHLPNCRFHDSYSGQQTSCDTSDMSDSVNNEKQQTFIVNDVTTEDIPSPIAMVTVDNPSPVAMVTVDMWGTLIPEELLLKIFRIAIESFQGPVPFLCRTAQVCRRWQFLSYHLFLWRDVDLSIGWITRDIQGLKTLCDTRLQHTTSLNLTAWFGMDDQCLQWVLESCSCLKSLNLSHCDRLTPGGLLRLCHGPATVEDLYLCYMSPQVGSHGCLKKLIQGIGPRLRKLSLVSSMIDNEFGQVLQAIANECHTLEELDLSRLNDALLTVPAILVDIEQLQIGCPRLRVLTLNNSCLKARPASEHTKAFSPGFPLLKTFSAPIKMNSDFCQRLLKSSFDLEKLKLTAEAPGQEVNYHRLPIIALRKLVIRKSLPRHIHVKWHQSLEHLDLSWLRLVGRAADHELLRIFDPKGPVFDRLKSLVLCGIPVSVNGLRPVFDCCPRLVYLNLNFCGGLPYGWSQEYRGAQILILKHVRLGLPTPQAEQPNPQAVPL